MDIIVYYIEKMYMIGTLQREIKKIREGQAKEEEADLNRINR